MNLSRRSFIFGGAASLVGAGAVLGGCNHRVGGQAVNAGEAIKVAMVDYFDKFDFVGAANPTIVSIGWHILEGLYDINPYTNETYPALAEDSPDKIDDLTYEITLRENAKYSNDAKVMAGDIINSINVAKKKESISGYLDFIRSVESAGNNKIKLNLNYPVGDVLEQRLSLAKITPASASDVDKTTTPVGTGPYMITEMNGSVGGEIKFTPNSNYNGDLATPENPMLWTIPADGEARAAAVKNGSVYICEDLPLDRSKEIEDKGLAVEYIPGFECANFFFHTTNKVFSHRELRQAVYYAVNTERLINEKMNGHAGNVTCVLAETNKDYHPASTIYNYDPEKAKNLIDESGISNPEINFVADKNC
ncbi:MAG: ABC transporter substrate-binding protein [Coriobacteriia bacterium]|nr:ABC transporter substrate-binding protein [Coriobacteriia bacterium]